MEDPARNTAYEVTDKKGERKTNTIGYRILGLILVILLAHNLAIAAYRGAMSTGWRGTDESQYYRAAKRLAVGQPLYSTTPTHLVDTFVYPPYMAFIFRPMLSLGKLGSYRLWLGTIITLLIASCVITALYFAETQTAIWLLIPLFFVTGFRCWPSVIEFALGNVQMVLLFLTCLMCITAAKGRWKTFILLLAAAAMVKTWMVGFVMVPLFAKQYRMAIYAMVITMLLLCAAFFIVGWQQFPRFIETTRMYSVQPDLIALSASGIARQLFSANKIMHPIFVSSAIEMGTTAIFYCWIGFLAFKVISCAWLRKPQAEWPRMLLIPFCAACALVTLPLCHIMYFILLLPGIWAMFAMALHAHTRTRDTIILVSTATACYLILAFPTPTTTPVPIWAQTGWARLLTALPLLAAVLCATTLAWLITQNNA